MCVVALLEVRLVAQRTGHEKKENLPKWIPNDQESNINLFGIFEDIVAAGLDEFAVCNNHRTAIVSFLLIYQTQSVIRPWHQLEITITH